MLLMKRKRRSKSMIRFNPETGSAMVVRRASGAVDFGSRRTMVAAAAIVAVGVGAYVYRDKIKALLAPRLGLAAGPAPATTPSTGYYGY